jgi:hypothetical protein
MSDLAADQFSGVDASPLIFDQQAMVHCQRLHATRKLYHQLLRTNSPSSRGILETA